MKKQLKRRQVSLEKAIDDTATGLTDVASNVIGSLISYGAESLKDSLFKKEDEEDD